MWEIYSFRKLLLLAAAAAAFSGVNLIMESPEYGNELILWYLRLLIHVSVIVLYARRNTLGLKGI